MGKNKKKKKNNNGCNNKSSNANPLWKTQRAFLDSLTVPERTSYFSNTAIAPERRAELWMAQADLNTVDQFAWATPDERAIRIIKHFSPVVEIGCGANAYWCRLLAAHHVDIVGYDASVATGGRITEARPAPSAQQREFKVLRGGPEKLVDHGNRTLFLCYPDENVGSEEEENTEDEVVRMNDTIKTNSDDDKNTNETISMAAACLEHYSGDYVIHVGELYGDTPSIDQAPWGRSSSAEFQERLVVEYHCILSVALQNWLHTSDSLTVWKRSETCTIVFAGDSDVESDEDEEVEYRHVPVEERLPRDVAAPCLAHLLHSPSTSAAAAATRRAGESKAKKPTAEPPHDKSAAPGSTGSNLPASTSASNRNMKRKQSASRTATASLTEVTAANDSSRDDITKSKTVKLELVASYENESKQAHLSSSSPASTTTDKKKRKKQKSSEQKDTSEYVSPW